MRKIIIFTILGFISSCKFATEEHKSIKSESINKTTLSKKAKVDSTTYEKKSINQLQFSNGPSREKFELYEKTIIIVQLDSLEMKQLKTIYGEGNFYTSTDDLLWYNSMLLEKTDSLGISVKETDKDTIQVYYKSFTETIVKDSTFTVYTYFYFDNKELKRKTLFELIE
ncbi:hypothetical protein ACOSP6_10175 [Tenacibaculum sp. MEBiC06402]|uniref:hypothetical protein n=1 Tax=unclassified Tenacibaculum TaxID=2635139 RepID=UPI003B9C0F5E